MSGLYHFSFKQLTHDFLWDRRRASVEHIRSVKLSTNKAEVLSVKSTFGKPLAGEVSNLHRSNSCLNCCYLAEWKLQGAFTPNLMMRQQQQKKKPCGTAAMAVDTPDNNFCCLTLSSAQVFERHGPKNATLHVFLFPWAFQSSLKLLIDVPLFLLLSPHTHN